jgi:hypothetical protein
MNRTYKNHVFLFAVLLVLSKHALALDVKSVAAAGSGCKASEKLQVNASDNSLEIMVPDLKTEGANGKKLFRSNCNISIALDSDSGKQFKAVAIKTSYEISGSNTDRLSLNFKLWLQGESKTTLIDHSIDTSKGSNSNHELTLPINEDNWSACKKENVFNAGISFIGKNQNGFSKEYILKLAKGLKVELLWRPCS